MGAWVLGGVMGLLGLFGLVIASRAEEEMFAFFGYGLVALAIAVIFTLIHRYTGTPPEDGGESAGRREPAE